MREGGGFQPDGVQQSGGTVKGKKLVIICFSCYGREKQIIFMNIFYIFRSVIWFSPYSVVRQ